MKIFLTPWMQQPDLLQNLLGSITPVKFKRILINDFENKNVRITL